MKYLPAAKSGLWLLWMVIYGLALSLLMWGVRYAVREETFSFTIALRLMLLSYGMAAIVNLFGWLGARWLWLLTTAGIVAGMAVMLWYAYRDLSGWEDLIGFLSFLLIAAAGLVLGALAEGIRFIAALRRSRSRR